MSCKHSTYDCTDWTTLLEVSFIFLNNDPAPPFNDENNPPLLKALLAADKDDFLGFASSLRIFVYTINIILFNFKISRNSNYLLYLGARAGILFAGELYLLREAD